MSSGLRKGTRGEGRGARVSLDYTSRYVRTVHLVHTVHIFLRRKRLTMLNPRL